MVLTSGQGRGLCSGEKETEADPLAKDSNAQTGREGEKWNTKREREREGKKSVLHHAGKYTGCAISTHVSFHKFLSREGKLLGKCP